MSGLKAQLEISADASGVAAGVNKAKQSLGTLGDAARRAGKEGKDGLGQFGSKGDDAARAVDRATKSMIASIQRTTAAMDAGDKTSAKYFETIARQRGIDPNVLRPYLDQLDLVKTKHKDLAASMDDKLSGAFSLGMASAAASVALLTTGLVRLPFVITDGIDAFNDIADSTGASIEEISRLEDVALRTGASLETVGAILTRTNKLLKDATPGSQQEAMFKAIGLSVVELRRLDPAEAVQAIAVAFDKYEGGGNKARLMQEMFGKSTKELAPLFKDLAEKGLGLATVTSKQADEAEKFNQQLFALKKNALDAARSIVGGLIPSLTEALDAFAKFKNSDVSIFTAGVEALKGNVFSDAAKGASHYSAELAEVDKKLGILREQAAKGTISFFDRGSIKALEEDRKKAADLVKLYQSMQSGAGGGRGVVSPTTVKKPQAPDIPEAPKDKTSEQNQIRKAQLDSDLADIRARSEELISGFAGGEAILQAIRSAGLVSESAYYAAKLAGMKEVAAEKDSELAAEIRRLEAEKVVGAERIKIDKQISEAESKRRAIAADLTVKTKILGIEQEASLSRVKGATESARQSAQEYLDTLTKQQNRTVEGIGQGTRQRNFDSGLNQIEDRYAGQRRDAENERARLQSENRYTEEARKQIAMRLALIDEFQLKATESYGAYYDSLIAKESDWQSGVSEGYKNYLDGISNTFKQAEDLVSNSFKGMEDALVKFAQTGKLDFASLANSIISDMIRIQARALMSKSMEGTDSGWLNGLIGKLFGSIGGSVDTSVAGNTGGITSDVILPDSLRGGRAIGGPVSAGGLYRINEKSEPEVLSVSGKSYLMMGSKPGSVSAAGGAEGSGGGSMPNVSISISNPTGVSSTAEQSTAPDGSLLITIINQAVAEVDKRISQGGSTRNALMGTFGVRPQLARMG
jgi:lambda family phage tail tape measure protein